MTRLFTVSLSLLLSIFSFWELSASPEQLKKFQVAYQKNDYEEGVTHFKKFDGAEKKQVIEELTQIIYSVAFLNIEKFPSAWVTYDKAMKWISNLALHYERPESLVQLLIMHQQTSSLISLIQSHKINGCSNTALVNFALTTVLLENEKLIDLVFEKCSAKELLFLLHPFAKGTLLDELITLKKSTTDIETQNHLQKIIAQHTEYLKN